ncbi:MAG: hypothetical protein NTV42_07725 [Chloroflexi bacterium]|nr:hypothetical protein [Chloroflexota bacterium]
MKNGYILVALAVLALAGCSGFQLDRLLPKTAAVARPDVVIFKAEPSRVESGSVTRLRWDVNGAETITIDHGIGRVGGLGNIQITPSEITAYNLTAVNGGGTVVSSVIINVVPVVVKPASLPTVSPASSSMRPSNVSAGLLPKLNDNEEYVFYKGAVMVGACNQYIVLRNNPSAKNPAWAELKAFLKADQTDRQAYIAGKFTCGDFAEILHNNAEAAGIRAAIVAIELKPAGTAEGVIYHSLDAFETTDHGLMYIDDTSSSQGYYADKEVNVVVGDDYAAVSIFPQPGQMLTWPSMGKIMAIDVFQW